MPMPRNSHEKTVMRSTISTHFLEPSLTMSAAIANANGNRETRVADEERRRVQDHRPVLQQRVHAPCGGLTDELARRRVDELGRSHLERVVGLREHHARGEQRSTMLVTIRPMFESASVNSSRL